MWYFINIRTTGRLNFCINFILVMGVTILGGCSSVANISTATNESPTETLIPNTAEPPVTSTTSPTALLVPEIIVNFQTFEIASDVPLDEKPVDVLVICSDTTIQLLHFSHEMKVETLSGITGEILCYGTSPDGKWIAYNQETVESPKRSSLIVVSADGQHEKKIPMNPDWRTFGDYVWLDNQQLIFNNFMNPPDIQRIQDYPAYPVVIFNPFTGEQVDFSSDYSDLQLSIAGPASRMDFGYSDVVYRPSLDLVIFPSWSGEHSYVVLWDRLSNSVLAKVEDKTGGFGHYPIWSPNAEQFVISVANSVENENIIEEWFSVNQDGRVGQLTHFGDHFISSDIGSASSWSPDGQKIAFWLEVNPSLCLGLNLALLDIATRQVTDTCVPGHSDYTPPPIWSLDSRYIVVVNANKNPRQTILIDIEKGRAYDLTDVTEGSMPVGWLVSP